MKNSNYKEKNELVAYAQSFVSFILPNIDVNEIILFGSVVRGEADEKSDIDLFFNIIFGKADEEKIKKEIKDQLQKFYSSKICEIWNLKGIKNNISIETGNLNKWALKRSIIAEGIVLYGKYKELPEKTKHYTQFVIKPIKNIAKRNKIIRILFGRKEKSYSIEGIVSIKRGKKLSPLSFMLPKENSHEIIKLLNSEKISYFLFDFWTDEIA